MKKPDPFDHSIEVTALEDGEIFDVRYDFVASKIPIKTGASIARNVHATRAGTPVTFADGNADVYVQEDRRTLNRLIWDKREEVEGIDYKER